jgi:DNA-binding CsgD family transcriptional regulator
MARNAPWEGAMERSLFGRQAELGLLTEFLDAVPSGPVALILGGEAGIGKSALWLEALAQARARSYRVLSCRPNESEAKLSFAALGDILEGADIGLEGLPPPQRSALEIALLHREAAGSAPDQRAISSAFLGTLLTLAATAPTLVAIDDVPWLDAPSARVLVFAVRRLNDAPIGLVMTLRTQGLESLPLDLGRALPEDRLRRLLVGPIAPQATRELLSSGSPKGFPRSVVQRIHEASSGNPFLALELGRALVRRGAEHDQGRALPVPSDLAALVRDRLSDLSDPVRQVLLITSAASQPTVPLVAQAIGGPAALDDIEAAFDAGVIEESGGRIRAAHPLLATVHYSESPGRARRATHRRLASVVVEQEERARHLALAADGPDEAVAAELEDAAGRAAARGAPDAAAQLSELARELTPPDRHEERIHRTVHAGQFAFEAADLAYAGTLLEEAVGAAPAGPLRAEALLFLARVRYHSHDAHAARALAEQALEEAEDADADVSLKAQIHLELAAAAEALGDPIRARVHAGASVDLAEGQGDDPTLAEALALVGFYEFLAGKGVPRGLMSRAIALEGSGRDPRPLRSPTFREACVLLWTDELDPARSTLGEIEKRCREAGDEGSLAVILFMLAQVECWAGDWSEAGLHADESSAISERIGQQPYRALALSVTALIDAHRGHTESARKAADEGLELARQSGLKQAGQFNLSALGFLELSLGNIKEADRLLGPLAEGVLEAGIGEPGMLRFIPDEIEALVATGETDRARSLLEAFTARAETLGRTWALVTGERGRGLLAASQGDLPEAIAAFDRALDTHRSLDEPFELGRTLLAQGQAYRRSKKWRLARDSLGRSLAIFERLGAPLWERKARAELARIGGRAPGPDGLTPTEQEVADLVANGLTNRETARALFLSVNTVEGNLRRIYRKLGVRSRTELSRKLSEP